VPKSVKRVLQAAAIFGFILLLVAGGLLARLAAGPLSVDPMMPWLNARADAALPGVGLSVETAALAWHPRSGQAEIRLSGVRLEGPEGSRIALPHLVVMCEAMPLLFGELRPHSVTLRGAAAAAEWSAAAALAALQPGTGADGGEAGPERGSPGKEWLRVPEPILAWLAAADREAAMAGLSRVTLGLDELALTESASGARWRLPDAEISLERQTPRGWRLAGAGTLEGDDGSTGARLALEATWRTGEGVSAGRVRLRASETDLPALAQGIAPLAALEGLRLPLELSLSAGVDGEGRLEAADFTLEAGPGRIAWPGIYADPRAVDALSAELAYDPADGVIEINALSADFAGARLALSGRAAFPEDETHPRLQLSGGWDRLEIGDLVRYWPRSMAAGGRRWIDERIPEGLVRDAKLHLDLAGEGWAVSPMPASSFHLDFAFEALASHVLPPAPPLTGAAGTARLTADRLTIAIEEGTLDGLPVAGSTVVLSELGDPEVPWGEVRLAMRGPLPDLLRLIDHEPMGYASAFGVSPADLNGRAELTAALRFPLLADLPMERIDIDVRADIVEMAIPELFGGRGFEDGTLALAVDNERLSAGGSGRFAGIPAEITWRERFDPGDAPFSSDYVVAAPVTADDLTRLLGDPAPYLQGDMAVELTLRGNGPELGRARLEADLSAAGLALPELGWEKPAGRPARLTLDADFSAGDGTLPLSGIAFESGEDRIAGAVLLDAESGAIREAEFERFALGRTDVAGRYRRIGDGGMSIELDGRDLDLRQLLEEIGVPERQAQDTAPAPPLELSLGVERIYGLHDVVFEDVALSARREEGYWQAISFDASLGEDLPVALSLGPAAEAGMRAVNATAADTGKFLRGLGLFNLMQGGVLRFDGHLEGHAAAAVASGRIEVQDFEIVDDPELEAALEDEERSRLQEMIGEDGTAFNELYLPFRVENGIIDIDDARANGPEIGLTIEGQLDQAFERINVNGVIVPAYFLNSLLGHIPILGDIFTGGSGGGLFALGYRVEGALEDPEVTIDPLTAIMPGILRKPFEGSKGTIEPEPPSGPPDGDNGSGGEPGGG